MDEFLLQAELHLLKKKMSMESLHPSILASPYHLVSNENFCVKSIW